MNEDTPLLFDLPAVARKRASAAFDGGRITSDRGVMLLADTDVAWNGDDVLNRTRTSMPNLVRYERIAPFYDLLDFPFERLRYQALRPLLFQNLKGRLLDAGIGTGRNCAFYPPETVVSGIDTSPAMLARARRRCPTLSAGGRLYRMDVTALAFQAGSFDAAVATFLFCVLPECNRRSERRPRCR